MISVAVIILNYNGKALLKQFLPIVIRYSKQAKIIVADNNSLDGSQEFIQKHFPHIELIRIPENLGFCKGYNYAVRRVTADYYILLNSDVEVTPNWIEPVIELFEKDETIGAAQPKIRSYKKRDTFEYAGAAGGFIDRFGYPFCRGRLFDTIEKDEQQYDGIAPIFWASGACLFIRSSLFKKLNGFDEDFFAHMEEIDLCWRLHRLNYNVVCCSKSTVYHMGGATLAVTSPIKTYYNFRNGIAMLIKNTNAPNLMVQLPIRILLDGLTVFKFLFEGWPRHALAILKAYAYLIRKIRHIYHKRCLLKTTLPFRKTNLIYGGSIVVDYFLSGKKSYQELKFARTKKRLITWHVPQT